MQTKIQQFWEWFRQYEDQFREVEDPDKVVDMLNDQILEFGLFSWEIGPGEYKPFYLVISPNGNPERMRLSKMIISAAPQMSKWEFFYCKPPKIWDFKFEMYDSFMIKRQFDASNWSYLLEKKAADKITILIKADNIGLLDREDHEVAADLVITNIIGEELKINHLDSIEMVFDFSSAELAESAPISKLKWAFTNMI